MSVRSLLGCAPRSPSWRSGSSSKNSICSSSWPPRRWPITPSRWRARAWEILPGLPLVVLGIVMIVLAAGRFIQTTRDIDSAEQRAAEGDQCRLSARRALWRSWGARCSFISRTGCLPVHDRALFPAALACVGAAFSERQEGRPRGQAAIERRDRSAQLQRRVHTAAAIIPDNEPSKRTPLPALP